MENATPIALLGSVVVTLSGCLAWAIRHVITHTLPEIQKAHSQQIERLCETFNVDRRESREHAHALHQEVLGGVAKLVTGLEQTQQALQENQRSLRLFSSATSEHPERTTAMWGCEPLAAVAALLLLVGSVFAQPAPLAPSNQVEGLELAGELHRCQ